MSKLEIIATLLQKGHITLQEFIELTKEDKEYIYVPQIPYQWYPHKDWYQPDWTYRPWTQPYYYTDNLPINICNGTNTTTITYDSAFTGSLNSCVN